MNMKLYENYLFDKEEDLLAEVQKELAIDVNKDGLFSYKSDLSEQEHYKYMEQAHNVAGIYYAICKLFNLEDIGYGCGGGMISFSKIISQIDNQQILNESPILSRTKLLPLPGNQLAEVIISLFLDRDNWSKDILYSTILSDDNGNWLI